MLAVEVQGLGAPFLVVSVNFWPRRGDLAQAARHLGELLSLAGPEQDILAAGDFNVDLRGEDEAAAPVVA
eukprot:12809139-Alexandrium_andersonii.AAC.1